MSKQTIIDWRSTSLAVASCSGRGAGVKLDKFSCQPFSQDADAAAKTASQALTKAVADLGLAKSEATIVASREMVEVRTVNVPKMDSHELPDVIRFQAQRQLANMSDNWTLDFVMLPQNPGQEMQTALVGAISPADMSGLASACNAANIQLAHVALAPVEIARYALAAGNLSNGAHLILSLSEHNADLIILRAGHVVLVRGTKLPSERDQVANTVSGEVRRSLMAASSQLADASIESIMLLATPAVAELVEQTVATTVGASVSNVDPTDLLPTTLEDRERVALEFSNRVFAMAGAASLAGSDKETVIDFLDPKRRPPPQSNTLRYVLAAAASLMLIVAGISWWVSSNRGLDDELAFYEQQIEDKQMLVDSARKKMAQLAEIETFLDRSPNFLDEFTYIARRIPSSEKVLLGGPMCTILPDGRAQILVPVAADEDNTISEFEESLRDENHEIIRRDPQRIDGATGLYAWQTVETIRISDQGWDLLDDGSTGTSSSAADMTAAKAESSTETNAGTEADNTDANSSATDSKSETRETDQVIEAQDPTATVETGETNHMVRPTGAVADAG